MNNFTTAVATVATAAANRSRSREATSTTAFVEAAWSPKAAVAATIYYATTNLGRMHSWQSGGVDFDGSGGKED